jgi:hypothetical protein
METITLQSGDLEQLAGLDQDIILHHFGENSFEHLAWEQRQADDLYEQKIEDALFEPKKKYKFPHRTESPLNVQDKEAWIIEFHTRNNIDLPEGFLSRNGRAIDGMYNGMLKTYGIREEDFVSRNF